jgi:hypothetical protein
MSDARKLRRLAAKNGAVDRAAQALSGLRELTGNLKAALPEAERDLALLREYRQEALEVKEQLAEVRYHLDRQRAVFLRILGEMTSYGPFSSAGPVSLANVLELEIQYAAEYDAMRFLGAVAMLGAEEDS